MNSVMRALVVAFALCGLSAGADDAISSAKAIAPQDQRESAEHPMRSHNGERTQSNTQDLDSEEDNKAAVTVDDVLAELANRLAENNAQLGS